MFNQSRIFKNIYFVVIISNLQPQVRKYVELQCNVENFRMFLPMTKSHKFSSQGQVANRGKALLDKHINSNIPRASSKDKQFMKQTTFLGNL